MTFKMAIAPTSRGAKRKLQAATKVRTEFPENWLWSDMMAG